MEGLDLDNLPVMIIGLADPVPQQIREVVDPSRFHCPLSRRGVHFDIVKIFIELANIIIVPKANDTSESLPTNSLSV